MVLQETTGEKNEDFAEIYKTLGEARHKTKDCRNLVDRIGLPSDYECSYCCDQLSTMVGPRKLPCGHVFCVGCLRADTSSGSNRTTRARCSKKYEALDLDSLPVYELDDDHQEIEIEQAEEEEIPEPIPCPRPKCNNESMCYCDSCKTTLCEKHKEMHDELFEGHNYIQFDEYSSNPEKYGEPVCPTHKFKLSLACESCDHLVCTECDLTAYCGQAGGQHCYISLAKLQETLGASYQGSIDNLSELHTKFTTTSKAAWYRFDELVVSYDEDGKIGRVDTIVKEQIEEIKARAEVRKNQIRDFPFAMDSAVTEYVDGLHVKEHTLKDLENELSRMMRESHITEIIRENKSNRKKIDEALRLVPGVCDVLREMVVAPTGCIRDVEVELRPLFPRGLVKLCSSPSNNHPQCICITDRGDVLYYDYNQGSVIITTIHFKHTKATLSVASVVSLAQKGDRVYVGIYERKLFMCTAYNYEPSKLSIIAQFPAERPDSTYPQMAVCAEGLFIISKPRYHYQSLLVFDHNGVELRQVRLPAKPSGIWSLPGPHILLLEQSLVKYSISSTEAVRQQFVNIGGYWTSDSAGVIYRATNVYRQANNLEIHNIATGEKVGEMRVDENYLYNLSVRNNMLVAKDDKGRMHLYHLTY